MASLTRPFFDTSVLVGGLIDMGPNVRSAQQIMDAIASGRIKEPLTAWHCCLEFYSVSTRLPEEFRLSSDDAATLVEEELLGRFKIDQLPERRRRSFIRLVREDRVTGGRIYDAHIAEIARASGASVVVTENRRDFLGLLRHSLRVLSHAEFVAEM